MILLSDVMYLEKVGRKKLLIKKYLKCFRNRFEVRRLYYFIHFGCYQGAFYLDWI